MQKNLNFYFRKNSVTLLDVVECANPNTTVIEMFERFHDILEDEPCFVHCLLEKMGVINSDGDLNEQVYETYLKGIEWPQVRKTLNSCRPYYEKSCPTAATWYKCTKFILFNQ